MDYEHDDRRAADVPGASGAEGSGLPAGREPLDADLPSSRSPEVRAFDPYLGSGPGASGPAASGPADDLFDAMFLSGGLRPPAFAAVDHDLGFPPPEAPDLASAFLAALDAIDDRRFVTPVPDEPRSSFAPPPVSPVQLVAEAAAPGEPVYELRPQSRLELEAQETSESLDETSAEPAIVAEDVERLPWDTGRVPVAGLPDSGEITSAVASSADVENAEDVEEFAAVEEFATAASVEDAEPIEEAAYYAAGIDGDAGDVDEAEAAAVIAAESDAEAEEVAAAAAQADADAEAAAVAADAEALAEAKALAVALAEAEAEAAAERDAEARAAAEQAEFEAAIAAEAALDVASNETFVDGSVGASVDASGAMAFDAGMDAGIDASSAVSIDDDVFGAAFDLSALDALSDVVPRAAFGADLMPAAEPKSADGGGSGEDDSEFEPSIGMEPMDAAPMTFDSPDAFAPAPVAAAVAEPEPESDELEDLQDFVVFSLGDMRCVVPIRNVVEVGRIPDAAPVPNAPAWLYGLGNLRGQVLSLIDLRALFGVGRIKPSAGRMVVLRGDEDDITAGVMVDQVHQIVALSPARFKAAPASLPVPEKSSEYVRGVCDYGNFTMINLDVDGVLGVETLAEEAV